MNKHSPGCQALFAAWFFKIMSKLHKNANPRAAVHAKLASTAGVRGLQFACTVRRYSREPCSLALPRMPDFARLSDTCEVTYSLHIQTVLIMHNM